MLGTFILVVLGLIVYFLPTIIATKRNHKNRNSILLVNVLLGWTLLGWIIALVWSATDQN